MLFGRGAGTMLKLLGVLLLAGGTAAAGFCAAGQLTKRARALQALLGALELMERELSFRLTPMPELLERLSRQADPPADGLFAGCREGLSSLGERALAELWKAGVRQPALLLEAEELALLDGLGQVLGSYDGEGQLAALAQTCAALERALAEARSERKRMGRVYQTLGLAAGAFLAILLV